jgi:hypothetical protein
MVPSSMVFVIYFLPAEESHGVVAARFEIQI